MSLGQPAYAEHAPDFVSQNQSGVTPARSTGSQKNMPGRWWNDQTYVACVGLTSEQQRLMDAVFDEHRPALVLDLDALRGAQARLRALSSLPHSDISDIRAATRQVTGARASLRESSDNLDRAIRDNMTTEQALRFDSSQKYLNGK